MEHNKNFEANSGEVQTFTQEDVNRIVTKRLADERKRMEADVERRAQELSRKEQYQEAKEQISSRRLPVELLDVLDYSDGEKLNGSLDYISRIINEAVTAEVNSRLRENGRIPARGSVHAGASGNDDALRKAMGLS